MRLTNNVYGSIISGIHHDTSNSVLGAKQYATRNNLRNVSIRYNCGMTVGVLFTKTSNGWTKEEA